MYSWNVLFFQLSLYTHKRKRYNFLRKDKVIIIFVKIERISEIEGIIPCINGRSTLGNFCAISSRQWHKCVIYWTLYLKFKHKYNTSKHPCMHMCWHAGTHNQLQLSLMSLPTWVCTEIIHIICIPVWTKKILFLVLSHCNVIICFLVKNFSTIIY